MQLRFAFMKCKEIKRVNDIKMISFEAMAIFEEHRKFWQRDKLKRYKVKLPYKIALANYNKKWSNL